VGAGAPSSLLGEVKRASEPKLSGPGIVRRNNCFGEIRGWPPAFEIVGTPRQIPPFAGESANVRDDVNVSVELGGEYRISQRAGYGCRGSWFPPFAKCEERGTRHSGCSGEIKGRATRPVEDTCVTSCLFFRP
jgi:hypothetical protein